MNSKTLFAVAAVSLAMSAATGPASAVSLNINQNSDVAAGIAAFGASSPLVTWSNMFPPGTTWPAGSRGPSTAVFAPTATDPMTGSVVTANIRYSSLYIANWIDGLGFNLPGAAGPDLALNGPEDFQLSFTRGVTNMGFAVSTGLTNVPGQTDHTGAVFQLTASNGDTGMLTLLDSGSGLVAWVTVQSSTPFTSLTFFEPSGNPADQYFGDIVAATPLPSTWLLLLSGFAGLGFVAYCGTREGFAAAAAAA
jgi:hypothetical protein